MAAAAASMKEYRSPASMKECRSPGAETFLLPGIAARRQRRVPSNFFEVSSPKGSCIEASPEKELRRKPRKLLTLKTPSSCGGGSVRHEWTPKTPDPLRSDLRIIEGNVAAILFDFDGTLTASPGDKAQRSRKQVELQTRAPLLMPRLQNLRDAGVVLGIISKSSELTIRCALREAGLADLFDGPIVAKAVGFDGKAGFIEDLVETGALGDLGEDGVGRVLLVDDDVRELDRARARGIQTYPAPQEGGLQDGDFDEIIASLGLDPGSVVAAPVAHSLPSSPPSVPEEPVMEANEQRVGWTWLRQEWCRKRGGG